MANITAAIADRDRMIAELERRIEEMRAERATLVKAAILMGLVPTVAEDGAQPTLTGRVGKQPGAISVKWRGVLGTLSSSGSNRYEDISAAASLHGMELAAASVRDRVRKFVELGLLSRNTDGTYRVTEEASRKFNLSNSKAAPSAEEDAA